MRWIGLLSLLVTLASAAEPAPDHAPFSGLLARHVEAGGWVDYAGLAGDAAQLDAYIASLTDVDLDALSRDDRLALLINAYNAFTLRLILDHHADGKLASIFDIPEAQRWDAKRWRLGGQTVSLNQIEHELIRPKFNEPRIHFALVCAAVGCPPLRREAYTGHQIEAQLTDQSHYVHTHDRWMRFDAGPGKLQLTRIYEWYAGDFEQTSGSVPAYVASQSPEVNAAVKGGRKITISYLDYSWKLNDVRNRP